LEGGLVLASASVVPAGQRVAAAAFGVGVLILLAIIALLIHHAWLSRDPFYAVLALTSGGFAVALGYEAYAQWTNAAPTISLITARAFESNRPVWVLVLSLIMLLLGSIVVDFRGTSRVKAELVGIGGAALVFGGLIAYLAKWLPT